jgi:hypothetical protein
MTLTSWTDHTPMSRSGAPPLRQNHLYVESISARSWHPG